jgi:hypothetical protein
VDADLPRWRTGMMMDSVRQLWRVQVHADAAVAPGRCGGAVPSAGATGGPHSIRHGCMPPSVPYQPAESRPACFPAASRCYTEAS